MRHGRVLRLGQRLVKRALGTELDAGEVLARQDEIRPRSTRGARQAVDLAYVGQDVGTRIVLDAGDLETLAHAALSKSWSSLPAASSAMSSSEPPIGSPRMKICGTVSRPSARALISARLAGS